MRTLIMIIRADNNILRAVIKKKCLTLRSSLKHPATFEFKALENIIYLLLISASKILMSMDFRTFKIRSLKFSDNINALSKNYIFNDAISLIKKHIFKTSISDEFIF